MTIDLIFTAMSWVGLAVFVLGSEMIMSTEEE